MRKVVAAAFVALVFGGAAFAAQAYQWRVVKSKSISGQFAVTAVSASVKHPKALAIRFIGRGAQGQAVWACSKGFGVASWTRSYGKGLHVLGHVRGKDSCDVTASVSGQGRVTVQILKAR